MQWTSAAGNPGYEWSAADQVSHFSFCLPSVLDGIQLIIEKDSIFGGTSNAQGKIDMILISSVFFGWHSMRGSVFIASLVIFLMFPTVAMAQFRSESTAELMEKFVASTIKRESTAESNAVFEELKRRVAAKEPEAMHGMGWYFSQTCLHLEKQSPGWGKSTICVESFLWLKQLSENNSLRSTYIGQSSMRMLGEMYEKGIGTNASRYLAADWYIKAARAINDYGRREDAIRALEAALTLVPDHPAGLELRTLILR